ncbi:hypothetical protein CDD83_2915 [Cordyceps sp. RAO-2017]|nr:hypothetical protein CDD83_2915 [Cordyceps sp. RAO-2017]
MWRRGDGRPDGDRRVGWLFKSAIAKQGRAARDAVGVSAEFYSLAHGVKENATATATVQATNCGPWLGPGLSRARTFSWAVWILPALFPAAHESSSFQLPQARSPSTVRGCLQQRGAEHLHRPCILNSGGRLSAFGPPINRHVVFPACPAL